MQHFGEFRLDRQNACLWRGSQRISLRPKAWEVLLYLIDRAGQLVSKDELLHAVWPDTFVDEHSLTVRIAELRQLLEDDRASPRYIVTHHRRGYSFVADVGEAPRSEPAPQPPPAPAQRAFTATHPIVGRGEALRWLEERFHESLAGKNKSVLLCGEPGSGKTTLATMFLESAETQGALAGRGQCLELLGPGEPYMPVLEILSQLSRGPRADLVGRVLRQYAPGWLAQMPALMTDSIRGRLQDQLLGATRERMLREAAEAFEALAMEVPVVLFIDDLQWCDHATLDLIAAMSLRRCNAPLLIAGAYRPIEVILTNHPLKAAKQELTIRGACEELPVGALGEGDVAEYLNARLGAGAYPPELAAAVHARSGGNPLFMTGVIHHLERNGQLRREGDSWLLTVPAGEVENGLPESLMQMIDRQISRLPEEQVAFLEAASVAGVRFAASLAGGAAGLDEDTPHSICKALSGYILEESGNIEFPAGPANAWSFRHSLYREVLYARILPSRRSRLHAGVAAELERHLGDRAIHSAATLAAHFEEARDYARAMQYLERAAETAANRCANLQAVAHFERVIELSRFLPEIEAAPVRMRCWTRVGQVRRGMNDKQGAMDAFGNLVDEARRLKRPDLEVAARIEQGLVLYVMDRPESLVLAARTVQLADAVDDRQLRIWARGFHAAIDGVTHGFHQEAAAACDAALSEARECGNAAMVTFHSAFLAYRQVFQSRFLEAGHSARLAFQLAEDNGDGYLCLASRCFETMAFLLVGNWGDALRAARAGMKLADRNHHRNGGQFLRLLRAWLLVEASALSDAEVACEEVLAEGPGSQTGYMARMFHAIAQVRRGDFGPALEALLALQAGTASEKYLPGWILLLPLKAALAECYLGAGQPGPAAEHARALCECTERLGEVNFNSIGHTILAAASGSHEEMDRVCASIDPERTPLAAMPAYARAARMASKAGDSAGARTYREALDRVRRRIAGSLAEHELARRMLLASYRLD